MAFLPIALIVAALCLFKLRPVPSYLITLAVTASLALACYGMAPREVLTASLEGAVAAIWPICILMYAALFLFSLTLGPEEKELVKKVFTRPGEEGASVLLIALALGSVLEGLVGFGVSLMIPITLMAASGLDRAGSARAGLVAISTPTNFGSMGITMTVLSGATGFSPEVLSSAIVRYSFPITFLLPYLVLSSYRGTLRLKGKELKLAFLSGLLYSSCYTAAGILLGPAAPALTAGLALTLMLASGREGTGLSLSAFKPLLPVLTAFLFLLLPSLIRPLGSFLSRFTLSFTIYSGPEPGLVSIPLLNTPGILLLIGTLTGALILHKPVSGALKGTLAAHKVTLSVVVLILMVSRLMGYSGMTEELSGTLVALSGRFYPFFSPVTGMLGAFLTGTSTSSCILFGPVQVRAARALGMDALPFSSFNGIGAGVGKIPAPQNLVQAMGASGVKDTKELSFIYPVFLLTLAESSLLCFLACQSR